ncbi:hypothetical protein COU37_01560 [Candidatus Micrarchaeota archaeon CG10_big_fil_rev_8_21_14_0_10_45_29]|nr:MAG: hypothetical protein COU37_01560 [Candidatus Micrarchaeota archaeon CG10_big_fil_rev_8_21_14_0_10_45_29]
MKKTAICEFIAAGEHSPKIPNKAQRLIASGFGGRLPTILEAKELAEKIIDSAPRENRHKLNILYTFDAPEGFATGRLMLDSYCNEIIMIANRLPGSTGEDITANYHYLGTSTKILLPASGYRKFFSKREFGAESMADGNKVCLINPSEIEYSGREFVIHIQNMSFERVGRLPLEQCAHEMRAPDWYSHGKAVSVKKELMLDSKNPKSENLFDILPIKLSVHVDASGEPEKCGYEICKENWDDGLFMDFKIALNFGADGIGGIIEKLEKISDIIKKKTELRKEREHEKMLKEIEQMQEGTQMQNIGDPSVRILNNLALTQIYANWRINKMDPIGTGFMPRG